jgi:hypothetical protein
LSESCFILSNDTTTNNDNCQPTTDN